MRFLSRITWLKITYIVCLLALAVSCKKEETQVMPPLTFTGENTFGCYINGELFVPEKEYDYFSSRGGASSDYEPVNRGEPNQYYSITLNGSQPKDDKGIQMVLNKTQIDTGVYFLRFNRRENILLNREHGAYYRVGEKYHDTGEGYSGECQILKFDTINKIVSGTFEFTVFNDDDSTTVEITEGRFDITYNN